MKGSQESLTTVVLKTHGQADPANPSTGGSHRELWPTPDATQANDGVPWEKFKQGMMERRERVKQAVLEGKTKQGSGRSPNLCAAVQNPQWATPEAKNHVGYQVGQDGKVWPRLGSQVTAWATPQARDAKGAEGRMIREGNHSDLPSQTEVAPTGQWNRDNGKLNPRWVETLMGLPVGWTMASCAAPVTIAPTSCECWGTESSQQPLPEPSPSSPPTLQQDVPVAPSAPSLSEIAETLRRLADMIERIA
jgi:hypothetical protein